MTKKTIPSETKARIGKLHATGKFTNKDLADAYKISERSVRRILEEQSIHPIHLRMTVENAKMIAVVKKYRLTAKKLADVLATPALTPENVQRYLDSCTQEELARHFYTSGLVILAKIAGQVSQQHKEAKNNEPIIRPIDIIHR